MNRSLTLLVLLLVAMISPVWTHAQQGACTPVLLCPHPTGGTAATSGTGGAGAAGTGEPGHAGSGATGGPTPPLRPPSGKMSVGTQEWFIANWAGTTIYKPNVNWANAYAAGTDIWNPEFIADLKGFTVFRHMDTNAVNWSKI